MRNHYRMLTTEELIEAGLHGPEHTDLSRVLAERLEDDYNDTDLDAENEELQIQIGHLQNALEEARNEIISLECDINILQSELGQLKDDQ